MPRILNFDSFAKLYEAEGDSGSLEPKQQLLLNLICSLFTNTAGQLLPLTVGQYTSLAGDLVGLASIPADQKGSDMEKICAGIIDKMAEDYKKAGLPELWTAVIKKLTETYNVFFEQYKDDPDNQKLVADFVTAKGRGYLDQLMAAKKENPTPEKKDKATTEKLDLSYSWNTNDLLAESSLFSGDKGTVNDLIKLGTTIDATLKAEEKGGNKDLQAIVSTLRTKLDGILSKLAVLSKDRKQRKEITDEDWEKYHADLSSIIPDLEKKKTQILKSKGANEGAGLLYLEAQDLFSKAYTKTQEVTAELLKQAQEAQAKKEGDKEGDNQQEKIQLQGKISYDPAKAKEVNEEVKKVQKLIYDKFHKHSKIADSAPFKKFAAYFKDGIPDGQFGPATANIVKLLRIGFELNPNQNISQRFVDDLQSHTAILESYAKKFLTPFLLEAFDTDAFLKAVEAEKGGSGGGSQGGPRVRPVKDWEWGSDKENELWRSEEQPSFTPDDGKEVFGFDPKKFGKDIRDFQRMALNYIQKIGGKDKVSDGLPNDFGAGDDQAKFKKFLDSKPDGGFGPNTMAAVRYIRGLLNKKMVDDSTFKGKVEEFGADKFSYLKDNPRSYTISWALANALEQALK